jgi:hypothetical protein
MPLNGLSPQGSNRCRGFEIMKIAAISAPLFRIGANAPPALAHR